MSIKPEFAEKIFAGKKRVELRRVCPRVEAGDLVLVYVSSPVKALMGSFRVKKVVMSSPGGLWPMVEADAGLSRQEFDRYYSNATTATGIFVQSPTEIAEAVSLDKLRAQIPDFRPPQSYRYLSPGDSIGKVLFAAVGGQTRRT